LKWLKPGSALPSSKTPKVDMPDSPQQRRTLMIQLALIAAIITVIAIVAVSRLAWRSDMPLVDVRRPIYLIVDLHSDSFLVEKASL
jgi:hypothetical protein